MSASGQSQTPVEGMSVQQLGEICARHRGAMKQIAEELGITGVTVSRVLQGRNTSARVIEAARRKVTELLKIEDEWRRVREEQA